MAESPKKKTLREEARERTLGFVLAALGFVAGLAWNDAIKAFIEQVFPIGQNTLTAKFIYAILVTVVVVIVTVYLVRWVQKEE
jgi:uncharacterized membrane protein YidH (DUF202 family)